jgi:hypothetical protein
LLGNFCIAKPQHAIGSCDIAQRVDTAVPDYLFVNGDKSLVTLGFSTTITPALMRRSMQMPAAF